MRIVQARFKAALAVLLVPLCASPALAQDWSERRVDTLIDRAVNRRIQVDTTLRAWTARAAGTLQFLVELGDGAILPPRVVKLEQLASVVRWERPGSTTQRIIGRRDTMYFPGDAGFYSDRYGVITNNLGDSIRLGDGKDVRDLPHPLSRGGSSLYEFAIVDSLSLSLPARRVEVYELAVRPRRRDAPGVVGSIYLDRATGDVVRMAVMFTSAALLDRRIERLTLLLENLLVEGQWWLPVRQEVEVVRAGAVLDFPTRGIVRGRWDLTDHDAIANPAMSLPPPLPAGGTTLVSVPGNRITLAPAGERAAYPWPAPIDSALRAGEQGVGAEDVASVERQAERLVETGTLDRLPQGTVGGRPISDFVRVNRVEGLAVGIGGRIPWSPRFTMGVYGRVGVSDGEFKATTDFRVRLAPRSSLAFLAARDYREAGDVAEVSGVRNTISAQAFGDDNTNYYDVVLVGLKLDAELGTRHTLAALATREWQDSLSVNARPWSGTYGPTIPAVPLNAWRLDLTLSRRIEGEHTRLGWTANARALAWEPRNGGDGHVAARLALGVVVQQPIGAPLLHLETHVGGVVGEQVPSQELIRFGGIVTGPGYAFHRFAGKAAVSQRVELRVPVPFVSLPLLGYGRSPARATLAPYGHLTCVGAPEATGATQATDGCFPSVGVAFSAVFDLLRLDVAYGLRDGGWRFGVDLGRVVWGVL